MAASRGSTFGDLLRLLRSESGLTQEEMAERAGLSVRGISDLERGVNRFPYRSTVERLVEVLVLCEEDAAELRRRAARRRGPKETAADSPRSHLPIPPSPILGREEETATILRLIRWQGARLVTLTGTGGVGKTRLALEVASQVQGDFDGGVVFVSLAPLSQSTLISSAIASALGLRLAAADERDEAVRRALADREVFLVLDNFEHIIEANLFVADLLAVSPRLKVLTTSRTPLNIRGEQQFLVSPLPVSPDIPASVDDLMRFPGSALFMHSARAVHHNFRVTAEGAAAVAEICRTLDGLPLALELAAAWVKYQTPETLLPLLRGRLDLLAHGTGDLPVRQQTLRNTLNWSYRLLGEAEQRLFRRLSVFVGGAETDAVVAVCSDPGEEVHNCLHLLNRLQDANLVTSSTGLSGSTRIGMLETVHSYARELLDGSGEVPSVRDRHLAYYTEVAQQAEPALMGLDQPAWVARLEEERANIRSALQWAESERRVSEGLHLLLPLRVFWEGHGPLGEARQWYEAFLATEHEPILAREPSVHNRGLRALARLHWIQGDVDRAAELFGDALKRLEASGSDEGAGALLNNLAGIAHEKGNLDEATALYSQALELAEREGDRWHVAAVCTNLGNLAQDQGQLDRAVQWLERGLAELREVGDRRVMGMNLNVLGEVLRLQGKVGDAEATFRTGLTLLHETGDRSNVAYSLDCLARTARDRGDLERASRLTGMADGVRASLGSSPEPSLQAARDTVILACVQSLGDERTGRLRDEGQATSWKQLLECAGAEL